MSGPPAYIDMAAAAQGREDHLPPQVASRPYYDMQQDDIAGKDRLPIDSDNSLFVFPSADRAVGAGSDVVFAAGYFMMYFVPPTGKGTVMRRTFACYVLNAKLNYTNASNSKVLTFDPVDHSSLSDPFHTPDQVRTVELVGSSPTTWIGTLQLEPRN